MWTVNLKSFLNFYLCISSLLTFFLLISIFYFIFFLLISSVFFFKEYNFPPKIAHLHVFLEVFVTRFDALLFLLNYFFLGYIFLKYIFRNFYPGVINSWYTTGSLDTGNLFCCSGTWMTWATAATQAVSGIHSLKYLSSYSLQTCLRTPVSKSNTHFAGVSNLFFTGSTQFFNLFILIFIWKHLFPYLWFIFLINSIILFF